MGLTVAPSGWSPNKLEVFNETIDACLSYMILDYTMGKLGITNATLVQDLNDVGNLIKNTLGPRLIQQG